MVSQSKMGHLHVATVEELQPFRDTQMAAEGALETDRGLSPICLGDKEKVIQRKANNKLMTGIFF